MDVRQLSYFEAVYEVRSISHAATKLNVVSSAISHQVTALERELGVELFERKPRGMDPTEAGIRLHEHARSILRDLDVARLDLQSTATHLVGDIEVAMPFSVVKVIGIDLMRRVRTDHPLVRLLLTEAMSNLSHSQLVTGEADIALSYNPPPDKLTHRVRLLEEDLFCVGRPEIVGASTDPIALADIADLPLALLRTGTLARAFASNAKALVRLERNAVLQLASVAATIGALEAGLACSLAPKLMVREQLESGLLVARPIVDPTPVRTLYLLSKSGDTPTRIRDAVSGMIKQLSIRAIRNGNWISARSLVSD